MQKIIIIGAGGHAKVIADIVIKNCYCISGFLDDNLPIGSSILVGSQSLKVIGRVDECEKLANSDKEVKFIIGIGNNEIRSQIVNKYDISYATLVHPNAVIGSNVNINEGTVIMAGAIVNSCTIIGRHCIINTGATLDHDNIIEDFVHISPGVNLAGSVKIGENSWIGIGSNVINNLSICSNCKIGAGAVIIQNIEEQGTYVGVPARKVK